MTNTEAVTELMSHMSDAELASGIEAAKAALRTKKTQLQGQAVFAAGVLLVSELRRRQSV